MTPENQTNTKPRHTYRITAIGANGSEMLTHAAYDIEEAHRLAESLAEQCPARGCVYVCKVLSVYNIKPKRTDLE